MLDQPMGIEVDIKVLQVVQSYYPAIVYGGPIFSIHYTCQALARRGIEIQVATTNANGNSKLDVDVGKLVVFEPNYSVRYYDDTIISRFSLDFCWHLPQDIRSADVIHLQDVFSTYAAWTLLLASFASKPILISTRGTFTPWGLKTKRPWLKKLWLLLLVHPFIRKMNRVTWHATSEAECGEILTQFPKARVHVVPNGIACAEFDKILPLSRLDYFAKFFPDARVVPDRTRVLVGLGRIHPIKGFDIAIRAFRQIADRYPDSVLLIAGGDDGEHTVLERLIGELALGDRVALVGELKGDDKITFLKGADLFLFPSHSENFGMAVLEALAAGLPVVASRNTPWAEMEKVGSGLWVDNTPEAFAHAIAQLLVQDLSVMRQKARDQAAGYDLTAIAARFENIYMEQIDANAK